MTPGDTVSLEECVCVSECVCVRICAHVFAKTTVPYRNCNSEAAGEHMVALDRQSGITAAIQVKSTPTSFFGLPAKIN